MADFFKARLRYSPAGRNTRPQLIIKDKKQKKKKTIINLHLDLDLAQDVNTKRDNKNQGLVKRRLCDSRGQARGKKKGDMMTTTTVCLFVRGSSFTRRRARL